MNFRRNTNKGAFVFYFQFSAFDFTPPLLVLRSMNTEVKPSYAHTNTLPALSPFLLVRARY